MAFKTTLGIQVDRAAAADPQNVWQAIFTIAGGWVLVKMLWGIRTVIQAGGASTMQFRHTVGPTVLDAGTLAVTGQGVGTLYYCTFAPADPIIAGAAGVRVTLGQLVASAATYGAVGMAMFTGNIEVTMTAAAGTGSTAYSLIYIPLSAGATVVAA
jgi:hypothetical protein